jgi:hypothetical protein
MEEFLEGETMAKKKTTAVPTPVKYDSRICFGIAYFTTEEDAMAFDRHVRALGITYNGGYFHGMACGRDKTWDHVDQSGGYLHGKKLYAVTQ